MSADTQRSENPDTHKLPMITSCLTGWINFMEMLYPHLVEHQSTSIVIRRSSGRR
ncbi:MAG: hypothetical protein LBR80_10490 [Deltaproteobacteria bacterium]|nr:hypothetical protein [Deltaproteobacteria bacterium]